MQECSTYQLLFVTKNQKLEKNAFFLTRKNTSSVVLFWLLRQGDIIINPFFYFEPCRQINNSILCATPIYVHPTAKTRPLVHQNELSCWDISFDKTRPLVHLRIKLSCWDISLGKTRPLVHHNELSCWDISFDKTRPLAPIDSLSLQPKIVMTCWQPYRTFWGCKQ